MARTQASNALQPRAARRPRRGPARLDHATVLGLLGGFGLLIAAMALGGAPGAFADLPAFLIVVGGTIGVTTACFSLGDIARTPAIVARAFTRATPDPAAVAFDMLTLADSARRKGLVELDRTAGEFNGVPFVREALAMAVDGTPLNEINVALERDVEEMMRRHASAAAILRKAADVAPAMGLIGTLIGLVQMLGNLSDPNSIGPGLAVALLTTFYGAVLANMVFAPLASKLERNTAAEALVANVYMLAAESICRKDNPRRLELLLNAMLPPAKRIQYFS